MIAVRKLGRMAVPLPPADRLPLGYIVGIRYGYYLWQALYFQRIIDETRARAHTHTHTDTDTQSGAVLCLL